MVKYLVLVVLAQACFFDLGTSCSCGCGGGSSHITHYPDEHVEPPMLPIQIQKPFYPPPPSLCKELGIEQPAPYPMPSDCHYGNTHVLPSCLKPPGCPFTFPGPNLCRPKIQRWPRLRPLCPIRPLPSLCPRPRLQPSFKCGCL